MPQSTPVFTLADCPTPYPPFMAGAQLPEISVVIPLKEGEDLAGAVVQMILVRDNDPVSPDILEKTLTELENIAGRHWSGVVKWTTSDLIVGNGQQATFILTTAGGEREPLGRWNIDVFENPDPTP